MVEFIKSVSNVLLKRLTNFPSVQDKAIGQVEEAVITIVCVWELGRCMLLEKTKNRS